MRSGAQRRPETARRWTGGICQCKSCPRSGQFALPALSGSIEYWNPHRSDPPIHSAENRRASRRLISKRHRSGIDISLPVGRVPGEPHDSGVSMVVERGLARCPRCVSVADYVFIESVSGRAPGGLRYEVRCRKCGECYGEDSRPLPHQQVVVAEPPIEWPPDREPVEAQDWRSELRGRLSVAAQRGRSEADVLVRRTRALVLDRRFGRKCDQTGG